MEKSHLEVLELESQIDNLRMRMIYLGKLKGFVHPDTVKCSQELDGVLNKLHEVEVKRR